MGFLLLGIDSLIVCLAVGPLVPKQWRLAYAGLFGVLDGIAGSVFPPRPHDEMICRYCAYPSVCRKDYVGDE